MNNFYRKNKKGFTLLELLISASIFATVVVIGVDLFFTIVKIQKRTDYIQTIQVDARNVLEEMASLVRGGTIDYAYYADPDRNGSSSDRITFDKLYDGTDANKILVIRDQDNNQYFFKREVVGTRGVLKSCVFYVSQSNQEAGNCDIPNNWQTVTPDNVQVLKFLIFVKPALNPFQLDETSDPIIYKSDVQPMVTIVLDTKTNVTSTDQSYNFESDLQTTVSSRLYLR